MSTARLLRLAAGALDDGKDPLARWFLSENEVTLDQAHSLASMLALGARVVAAGIERPRSAQGVAMLAEMVAGL